MKLQLVLLVLSLIGGAAMLIAEPAEEKSVWHADWPTARRLARQANKPIFAVLVCKH